MAAVPMTPPANCGLRCVQALITKKTRISPQLRAANGVTQAARFASGGGAQDVLAILSHKSVNNLLLTLALFEVSLNFFTQRHGRAAANISQAES